MAERGILFSAPMVRALLDGRKTQTRRLISNPEYYGCPTGDCPHQRQAECNQAMQALAGEIVPHAVGDRLWVRESFSYAEYLADTVWYWADGNFAAFDCSKPKPSIHMPRWASRLWLTVTDVRVQRLQDIMPDDAIAEGLEPTEQDGIRFWIDPVDFEEAWADPRLSYLSLWNSLHTDPGTRWADNPWIYALTFTVHQGNIDD